MRPLRRSVWLLPALLPVLALPARAQENLVSGTVTAEESGEPLAGVSVVVQGTPTGALTDEAGSYRVEAAPGATLVFRRIGYAELAVPVDGRTTVDVALAGHVTQLDELVVVGYGEQTRATLTTSVSKLDTAALQNIPYASPASALQGTIAGLRVQSTSGQPGDAPRIVLRGGTSINNPNGSNPLFIVDGIIRPNINDINPLDIESVQVLKDAGATAIYGARASNGVVIVTTKAGEGAPRIN